MDFNTFLIRFGISSDNFINKDNEPIPIQDGFLYEAEQRKDERICPYCQTDKAHLIGYYFTETKCSETKHIRDVLRIKRVRFRCKGCGKTFSPPIKGIDRYSTISSQVKRFILSDFTDKLTFAQIADKYGLTKQRIIQIFDEEVKIVPRRRLPRVLCIDEIRFEENVDQKYCCVLYDYERKEVIDIISNRQMPYLREYFSNIPIREREQVEVFISDMYDAYDTICSSYFPHATHIVDMFHIVTQLTRAVNTLRINTMHGYTEKGSAYYNFMKSHWKQFLCRYENIAQKEYSHTKSGITYTYEELVFECIKLDEKLWTAHLALQDLFHFSRYSSFEEAYNFIEHLSERLKNADSELLKKVGQTYHRWRVEIANAYMKDSKGIRYTNAIAECLNNQLKTIIKSAYGYHNFARFRKRALLMLTYAKLG